MIHAHCRGCDVTEFRTFLTKRTNVPGEGLYDECRMCGSLDVDVLTDEGLAHERMEEAS